MRSLVRCLQSALVVAACAAALAAVPARADDPVITGLNRDHGPLLSTVIIYGANFGPAQGSSYVLFGGRGVPILAWTDNAIYFLVNPMAFDPTPVALDTVYPIQVVRRVDGKTSNPVNFTLTSETPVVNPPGPAVPAPSDQPSISGTQASTFCPDSIVALSGAGFGASLSGYVSVTVPLLDSQGHVFTQEFALPVLLWSENAIDVLLHLPAGAQFGTYTLTVHRNNGKSATTSIVVGPCPAS